MLMWTARKAVMAPSLTTTPRKAEAYVDSQKGSDGSPTPTNTYRQHLSQRSHLKWSKSHIFVKQPTMDECSRHCWLSQISPSLVKKNIQTCLYKREATKHERETPNTEERLPNTEERVPNTEERVPNTEERVPNTEERSLSFRQLSFGVLFHNQQVPKI